MAKQIKIEIKNISESARQITEKKQDIKYDTRDYVIAYLVEQYHKGEFFIPLSYQRNFVWRENDKCLFVESVLMGLPIPFMFFADTDDGRIEIVDGAQRIQTLVQFIENAFQLKGLEVLTKSNEFTFSDLDPAVQRRFLNTSIRVVFLEQGTTEQTRQEIFKRINTGGRHIKPAESRRGSYEGKFKVFLEECVRNETFNKLAPRTKMTEDRFEGFELVARFFAYSEAYRNGFKGYNGNVSKFIDKYVEKQNAACKHDDTIIPVCKEKFEKMLDYAKNILGDRGFRKSEKSQSTPRARFEALAIGIILALEENPNLPGKDVSGWIDSAAFAECTRSDAANNKGKLVKRIEFVKDLLLEETK